MYENGLGVSADNTVAADYYNKAAKLGHIQAQEKIGYTMLLISLILCSHIAFAGELYLPTNSTENQTTAVLPKPTLAVVKKSKSLPSPPTSKLKPTLPEQPQQTKEIQQQKTTTTSNDNKNMAINKNAISGHSENFEGEWKYSLPPSEFTEKLSQNCSFCPLSVDKHPSQYLYITNQLKDLFAFYFPSSISLVSSIILLSLFL